ncbi:unnamed protein product [Prunus armeniaca]|uniref:Myb-like domain-containing protein n=1 Tax=Prunus armeniaca TaxID=36596 RepID=A0A6J5UQ59_PRUAR|nr:unnamed protein product [Prunus armeniaca]
MALLWRLFEDALLMRAVKKYGIFSWDSVSAGVGTRSAWECKQRWYHCLDPRVKKTRPQKRIDNWNIFPNGWTIISHEFNGSRTSSQCQMRHQSLYPPAMHVPIFNSDGALVHVSQEETGFGPHLALRRSSRPVELMRYGSPAVGEDSKASSSTKMDPKLGKKFHQSKASSSTKVDPKLGKKRRINDVKQPLLDSPEPEPHPGLKEIGIFGSTRMKPSEMRLVETLTRGLLSEGFHIVTVSLEMGTCEAVRRGLAEAHCTVLPNERDVVARVQRIVAFAYRNSTIVLAACAHAKAEGKEAFVFYLD